MRELLATGAREDQAIVYLFAACLLIFIGQWPRLSRNAYVFDVAEEAGASNFLVLMTYEFVAWLMVWPLAFYFIAALSHVVAKALGGKGNWLGARLALFWSLLVASPVLLLHGLTSGLIGPGNEANLIGAIWLAGFSMIWLLSLFEAERAI